MDSIWDRYASPEMAKVFSDKNKYHTWRTLWYLLAKEERSLGANITGEQLDELKSNIDNTNTDRAKEIESETHHDVVAHIRHYAEQCPKAAPIIHLGATSCYITDNTDVVLMREAAEIIDDKLCELIGDLCARAIEYKDMETVGRTHFQPAQPTTVGKRVSMWTQDFEIDLQNLRYQVKRLKILGCRGATGTCDSFLKLFDGNINKVLRLEDRISSSLGFENTFSVSGQTYTRKQDFYLLQTLSGIAQSASKMATDIRLLSGLGEMYEPFGATQVGSSAMPYKRNPIMCERICGLSRYVICNLQNAAITASSQWLERTLDDSSNRKIVIAEMFMAVDAVLDLCIKVVDGLQVDREAVKEHVNDNLNNYIVEGVLVYCATHGKNRQTVHEELRKCLTEGDKCLYIQNLADNPEIGLPIEEIQKLVKEPNYGIAGEQTSLYIYGLWKNGIQE